MKTKDKIVIEGKAYYNGTGIYLPKSHTAWGYLFGNTIGGTIEMRPRSR